MSRSFAGGTDLMTYAQPTGAPAMNDALSLVMVAKITNASDNTWQSLMEFDRSGGGNACGMVRTPTGGSIGELGFINTSGTSVSAATNVDVSDADGWAIYAITRSAAAATTLYKIPIGGARQTETGTAVADGLAWNSVLKIGGDEDPATFLWAAGAYWNGVTLTGAQLDDINTAKTTLSISNLNPTWLVDDSDSFATNLVNPGSGNRTALVGTTTSGDNPSGWVYGLGAAATSLLVPKRAHRGLIMG